MKLATIEVDGSETVAILTAGGRLVTVPSLDPGAPRTLRRLLEQGSETLHRLGEAARDHPGEHDPDTALFLPLVPEPHAVWCATLNYATHVAEGNWDKPDYAGWFLRVAESLTGHGQPMLRPAVSDKFDYEGELAVIIGSPGRNIPSDKALDHVAGYCCFNDGSIRDWQRHTTQITVGKNFTATGAFGPYLVTPDELADVRQCRLLTRLNGTVMQDARIGDMTTPIAELISYLSTVGTLRTGDVVVTGTPGGVGARRTPPVFMKEGDVIEVEIEGVGRLRNPIRDAETVGT